MNTQTTTREGDREVKLLRYRVYVKRGDSKPELITASSQMADAETVMKSYAMNPEHRGTVISIHDSHTWNSPVVHSTDGGSLCPTATVLPFKK